MFGYILYDERGWRLTRNLRWSDNENAGWLWTEAEVRQILQTEIQPVYYQSGSLVEEEDGDVNVVLLGEPEEL